MAENEPMITEGVTKIASDTVSAMKSVPLAIALLVVNVGFLGFAAYILGEVAENARERNKVQTDLISSLVRDIRDCRQPKTPTFWPKPPLRDALPWEVSK
jgi:hypothetical protein